MSFYFKEYILFTGQIVGLDIYADPSMADIYLFIKALHISHLFPWV